MDKQMKLENLITFLGQMEKVKSESEKDDHPDYETIYLYAQSRSASRDAVSDEASGLGYHFDYCLECGEIYVDALLSLEIETEIAEGKLLADYVVPDLRKLLGKNSPATSASVNQSIATSSSLIKTINDYLANWFASFNPALAAAASEDSYSTKPLVLNGKEIGIIGASRDQDDTTVFAQLSEEEYSNKILLFKVSTEQHILALLSQREEYYTEGVASKFTFAVDSNIEKPLEAILDIKTLNAAFDKREISPEDIHKSISATDNTGKKAWRSIASDENIGMGLKNAILSHPFFNE